MYKSKFQLASALIAASIFWVPSAHTQTVNMASSTWFGSMVIHGGDGKVSHDNAVLVLETQARMRTGAWVEPLTK